MFQDTTKGRAAEADLCVSQTEMGQTKCRLALAYLLGRKPLVGLRLRVSLKTERGDFKASLTILRVRLPFLLPSDSTRATLEPKTGCCPTTADGPSFAPGMRSVV